MSKTDGEDQAFPLQENAWNAMQPGLTKREHFAAMAMQGFCANPAVAEVWDDEKTSKYAASMADALIAELAKKGDSK